MQLFGPPQALQYSGCFNVFYIKYKSNGSGGIRTHASEETGGLNQRLRPLGHATFL